MLILSGRLDIGATLIDGASPSESTRATAFIEHFDIATEACSYANWITGKCQIQNFSDSLSNSRFRIRFLELHYRTIAIFKF